MPKQKKGHTTPHICVPITNPRRNIPSDHDQQARYQLQHSVLDSFHTEIQGPVFLSVGPDAKLDLLKTFDLDKPFDLHLDPSSSENQPLCRITQDGKHTKKPQTFILQTWNQESGSSLPHQQITKWPHQSQQ